MPSPAGPTSTRMRRCRCPRPMVRSLPWPGETSISRPAAPLRTSDVMAPKGDIDIAAKSVEIKAAEQASKTTTEVKFKQSGLTVAVTSPVISAIQTVDQMADAASKTKDGRMQALAVANMGFAAKNAGDAIKAGQGSTIDGKANQIATGPTDPTTGKTPSRDANDADKAGGINLALSVGGSSSESRSEQSSNTVRGSSVTAGGSINISAQGGGADSNIVIQGSDDLLPNLVRERLGVCG
ncbi:hypothetical protein FEE59_25370 [Herbaspirillum sp. RU 5E]|nr:hypothetical protein [Herbaspirillum sp. RU 5E]